MVMSINGMAKRMSKPAFNPSLPFEVIEKPKFDPSKPFQETMFDVQVDKKEDKVISKEDVAHMIKSEIGRALASLKPQEKIIEKIKEVPVERRVIVREIDKEKTEEIVKKFNDALSELNKEKERLKDFMSRIGGSGVIGLPKASGQDGKVLTVVNGKAHWSTPTASGSGGLTSGTYSVSNPTEDRTFDADNTSLDEIADVLATLISDLGGL